MTRVVPICQEKTDSYVTLYPGAEDFADLQNENFWPWTEYNVEKDIHELHTEFSEAELHGVITTLKLFTHYEVVAGSEYWGGRFKRMFPRPEFQRMASAFSNIELNSHAKFYNEINNLLGLSTDEFYTDYVNDPVLKARMDFIEEVVCHEDDLISLGAFSIVEGAILYSNFAFLKHFQANGKNKLTNVVAGINQSVLDENIHSMGGAWAFKTLFAERPDADKARLQFQFKRITDAILDHESQIIDMIFEKGTIPGVTATQLKHFVESRLDLCLEQLGFEKVYKPAYNPIGKWFYDNITGSQFHDFFVKVGSEYKRGWNKKAFVWKLPEEEV